MNANKTTEQLLAEIEILKKQIMQLQNRCLVFTNGELCCICGMRENCIVGTITNERV